MELVALVVGVILSAFLVFSGLVTGVRYLRQRFLVVSFGDVPATIEDTGGFTVPLSIPATACPSIADVELESGAPGGVLRTFGCGADPERRGVGTRPGDPGSEDSGRRAPFRDVVRGECPLVLSGRGIRRGLYRVGSCRLAWDDPLSLFRLVYSGRSDVAVLRVLPGADDPDGADPRRGVTGTHLVTEASVRRNAELIESRPYYPGDDPRHIHWGMYAHTGELFLRIGEEVPPRVGTVTVALDHTAGDSHEILDRLIAVAVGWGRGLARPGRTVRVALLGRTPRFYDDVETARWEWAELAPTCAGGGVVLLPENDETGSIVYVTGGASQLSPEGWTAETIGIRYGGHVEAIR